MALTANAQSNKKAAQAKRPATSSSDKALSSKTDKENLEDNEIELLLNAYRFDEATELLDNKIKTAKRKKQETGTLEEFQQQVRTGQNMLQATEKVVFIDSMVVNKNDFMKYYYLSHSCGTLTTYGKIFPSDDDANERTLQQPAYMNEFKDLLIYSYPDKEGNNKLFSRNKLGNKWSAPKELKELADSNDYLVSPYLLSDGTTLYYAAEKSSGLGGLDIFVTRYDTDTKKYLKPENIGMPFNSPANDYLYAIDETNNLGWFVSDRNQPENKVCIYVFIPTEVREVYKIDDTNEEEIRQLAKISSIKQSQKNRQAVADALKRLAAAKNAPGTETKKSDFLFIVANGVRYTDEKSFKSSEAAQLAAQWKKAQQQRTALLSDMKKNRHDYAQGKKSLKQTLLDQEKKLSEADASVYSLENKIRQAEQKKLGLQ